MSEQEKMGPQEFSEALFNALNDRSGTSLVLRESIVFPWEGKQEDHAIPEGYIASLYESLKLKAPRFAWATSPAAMYTAINLLKGMQAGQRHKFIESLVVADDPMASAKRTVLDAIIDRTVMTTLGGAVKSMIPWKSGRCSDLWFADLKRFFASAVFGDYTPIHRATRPWFNEVTVYPVDHFEGMTTLQPYVLAFVPYMHVCFFCLPPVTTALFDNGHLCEMQFSDGYVMRLQDPDIPELPVSTVPALPSAEQRRVLFAMCAMNKHEGCSGVFVDEQTAVRTICSCECHQIGKAGASDKDQRERR